MAVDIFVNRGAGDKRGQDIIDPLTCTVAVALERGRNELDAKAVALRDVGVEAVYRIGLRHGQLVGFTDPETGLPWRGKVTSVSHRFNVDDSGVPTIETNFNVQKPTSFYG